MFYPSKGQKGLFLLMQEDKNNNIIKKKEKGTEMVGKLTICNGCYLILFLAKKHMHTKDHDERGRPTVKTQEGSFAVNSLTKQSFE